jgi:glutamyl-tRNA reductase
VTYDMVKRVMKARKGRTLFFIDIAVPRNVDPRIHTDIDNAYVYDIDDLEKEVAFGLKARQGEVSAAEKIVGEEVAEFEIWARGLNVSPTIVALRARTKAVLQAELERSLAGRLKHLQEGDRAALQQMIDSALNKLLHAPTTRLKAGVSEGDGADLVRAVVHLFDLPETTKAAVPEPPGARDADDAPSADDDERLH